jgi:hypothetical protein
MISNYEKCNSHVSGCAEWFEDLQILMWRILNGGNVIHQNNLN